MKNVYSHEELENLLDFIPKRYAFHRGIKQFLKNGYIIISSYKTSKGYRNKRFITKFNSLENYTRYRMPPIYVLLFILPLDDLPLYINSKNITLQSITKWRLNIGK